MMLIELLKKVNTVQSLALLCAILFSFSFYVYAEDKAETKEKLKDKADLVLIKELLETQVKVNENSNKLQKDTNDEFKAAILELYKMQYQQQARLEVMIQNQNRVIHSIERKVDQ